MPNRRQRSRRRGSRMPAGAVYVGRPTRWGNPFPTASDPVLLLATARQISLAQAAKHLFEQWLLGFPQPLPPDVAASFPPGMAPPPSAEDIRRELGGKDLLCWCALHQPCHADVLLSVANPRLQAAAAPPGES